MDAETLRDGDLPDEEAPDDRISRGATGLRVLLTLLFAVIWGVVETVLATIAVFALGWTLVSERPPPARLRELSNRLVAYSYRIWRYVTYGSARVPFPFSDFPESLEPPEELGPEDAAGLCDRLCPPFGTEGEGRRD